jgi:hypothetical protein
LVVLVDDDLKSNDAAHMARSLRVIAAGISSSDEPLICRFDLKFYPGEAFTDDLDSLLAQLRSAEDASGPSTAGPVFLLPDHRGILSEWVSPGKQCRQILEGHAPSLWMMRSFPLLSCFMIEDAPAAKPFS